MLVALLFICPAMLLLDPIIRIFSRKTVGDVLEVVAEPGVQGGPPAAEAVATPEPVILTGAGEQSTEKDAEVGNDSATRKMGPIAVRKQKVSARLC